MQRHPDCDNFIAAAKIQFSGIQDESAWEIVNINDVPEYSQTFLMRLVFIRKSDKEGKVDKHNAHIVARGNLDKKKL